jgi:hypothetical protein
VTVAVFVVVVALLLVVVGAWVLWPLFRSPDIAALAPEVAEDYARVDEREAALTALRDVELEYRLGNLTDSDYRQLRERYYRRALAALRGRTLKDALDEELEREIAALRAAGPKRCAQCDAPLADGACPECGMVQVSL